MRAIGREMPNAGYGHHIGEQVIFSARYSSEVDIDLGSLYE